MADEPPATEAFRRLPPPRAPHWEPSSDATAPLPLVPGGSGRRLSDDVEDPDGGPRTAAAPAVPGNFVSRVSISEEPLPEHGIAPPLPQRGFRERYAVVYDVDGPRVRLGMGWALLVAGALAYGPTRLAALAALYGATAAWAAVQILASWRPEDRSFDRWVSGAGAAALPLATAAFGVRGTGAALIGFVAVALLAALVARRSWRPAAMTAGRIVTGGAWAGTAAAAVVLTLRYEIGAVITLLVLVAVYEASDYIVGSGASNRIEGPAAGIISIAVITAAVAFLQVPPFEGRDAFAFGALAAVLCPVGQFVASGLLPSSTAQAPALRRLDSLLVLAPLWAWAVGLLLVRQA